MKNDNTVAEKWCDFCDVLSHSYLIYKPIDNYTCSSAHCTYQKIVPAVQ